MNIREIFKDLNIQFWEHGEHHHTTEGRINVDCPYCSPNQQRARLGWHLKDSYFSCWNCGPQQTINTFMALTDMSFGAVKDLVKGILPEDYFEAKRKTSNKVKIPESVGPLHPSHIKYLYGRGFTNIDQLVADWQIQGINHLDDRLAWRIFIPVVFNREVVSWTTRSIGERQRYLSAGLEESKLNLKQLLYGEDYVDGKTIIVFEGPIDVWKVGRGATSILGLEYTNYQVRQIAKYPIRYICMDTTDDAQEVAEKLCADLDVFDGETHNIVLETAKDAAAAKPREVKQLQRLLK